MALQFKKSISDPIYGTIPLTDLELRIIDTPVFQRLRHVQNLGLAYYVFPSAIYSRFAHSLGACHTIGQMLERLEANAGTDNDELQFCRATMLLHDVGHYFMSHATEATVKGFYKPRATTGAHLTPETIEIKQPTVSYCDHEEVGRIILENDPDLKPIVAALDLNLMASMFKGVRDQKYACLVSSEMDADRLDYLMRSSQSTGLPYGHFDREYILQSLVADATGRVCLNEKAIRAADHFVLCRSFDYLQVIFHKTIVGFEAMYRRCVEHLLRTGKLALDAASVTEAVQKRKWRNYTDSYVLDQIKRIRIGADPVTLAMRDRIVKRRPARLLWSMEKLDSYKNDAETEWSRNIGQFIDKPSDPWAKNCLYWFKQFRTTDASPFRKSYDKPDEVDEAKEKSIQILRRDGTVQPLTGCDESFTRYLSDQAYVMARVYYVGPTDEEECTRQAFSDLVIRQQLEKWLRGPANT